MALMDFIKKQFIDILQWTESGDGTLAWRFPMQEMEIQNGASLTVRDSQLALFVNEGTVADVFAPGMYKLTTQTLPVLTYLKNWDKLFESPFKSDLYFFSRSGGFGYHDFGDFAAFGFDYTNALNFMLTIGSGQGFVFGYDIDRCSSNEVTVHTDDRTIHQLVVGEGLLLGCELPQLGAESVNGCF